MRLTALFSVSSLNYLVSMWIGVVLTLLIASLFLLFLIRFERKYHQENFAWSLIVTLAIATGQTGHCFPAKSAVRIFFASLFFFGLHINTAYHSYLINVLTNPRFSSQISSVQDAIGADMIFEVGENTVGFFEKEDAVSRDFNVRRFIFIKLFTIFFQLSLKVSQHLLRNHKICHDIDECFKAITKDRTKALAISRSHALNNPFQLNENDDFFCFPISDDVVIYSAVMMFHRFHHLLPTINEKIRSISESGLLTKWQKDSTRGKGDERDVRHGDHGGVQMILRVEHVEGAFLITLIGLAIAFVVFLLELLTHWLVKTKPSHRVLKSIENFLCRA